MKPSTSKSLSLGMSLINSPSFYVGKDAHGDGRRLHRLKFVNITIQDEDSSWNTPNCQFFLSKNSKTIAENLNILAHDFSIQQRVNELFKNKLMKVPDQLLF